MRFRDFFPRFSPLIVGLLVAGLAVWPAEAYVLHGNDWNQLDLTYSFSNLLDGTMGGGLSEDDLRLAVEEALNHWAAVTPLTFTEIADAGLLPTPSDSAYYSPQAADLRLGHHTFDGVVGTLAHGYYPPPNGLHLAGDIHFDVAENWALGSGSGVLDILEVATHELGHALGLDHEPQPPGGGQAIMNPYYGARFIGLGTGFLLQDDIDGIQAIYGAGVGSVASVDETVDRIWNQAISSSFDDLDRWSGVVPGGSHRAVFNRSGGYTVTLAADTTVESTRVQRGNVTVDLDSYRLTSTQGMEVDLNGRLTIAAADVSALVGDTVENEGQFVLSGEGTFLGDVVGSGTIQFSVGTSRTMAFAGDINGTGNVEKTAAGTLRATGGVIMVEELGIEEGGLEHQGGSFQIRQEVVIGSGVGLLGTYHLAGGELTTPHVRFGSGSGAFFWTNGTLRAEVVDFDLQQNGGSLRPATSSGITTIQGNYLQSGGSLDIKIGGVVVGDQFDVLDVNGTAELHDTLRVSLVGGFSPSIGERFSVLTAADIQGAFSEVDVTNAVLDPALRWEVDDSSGTSLSLQVLPVLAADFNGDGVVGPDDLTILANNWLMPAGVTQGDANGDGVVDPQDFAQVATYWLQSVGGFATDLRKIPEPPGYLLLIVGLLALVGAWWRHQRIQNEEGAVAGK